MSAAWVRLAAALGCCVAAAGCAAPPPPDVGAPSRVPAARAGAVGASAADRAAIAALLDDWHDAAAKADEGRYFGHFATNAVFLGTDATERWTLADFRVFAHPFFAKGKAWSFRAVRRDIDFDASGRVAWFDETLDTQNLGPCRGSGVLLRDASGGWRIAQYNLAVTVPNDRFDEVKKLLAGPPPER